MLSSMQPDPQVLEGFARDGYAVLPGLLSDAELDLARSQIDAAVERSALPTKMESLDPGGRNVRLYDLVQGAPIARDLARDPRVTGYVDTLLGEMALLSNFTANNALPGSGSMNPHCDQSTVMPPPWHEMFAMNAIWCLHDTDEENGATRYLPGSHRFTDFEELPADPREGMRSFEAKAGSVILMHGRLWHTSGENRSEGRERWLLFAFYARSFLRTQADWHGSVSAELREELHPELVARMGLRGSNMGYGAYLNQPGGHKNRL